MDRASRRLRKFMFENDIVDTEWGPLLEAMETKRVRSHKEDLIDRVIAYRMRLVKEEKEKMSKWDEKRFWIPINRMCFTCNERGHRTADCRYTFERVLRRMIAEEKAKEEKKVLAERGGQGATRSASGNKMQRRTIASKEGLFERFKDVFHKDGEQVKFCRIEKCRIETKKGAKVVKRGAMVPQALRKATDEYIRELEDRGIIRRSESEWRNPIRAIQKPNGAIRLVSNFMALNDLCEKDPYELRNIREVINDTQGNEFFTVIDLKEGFYSIEIAEEDKKKTAFEFDGRVYEWNSMVMGFKNAPQIMQRVMCKVLDNELRNGVSVYMDDVVVYGRTREEHDERLGRVLRRFAENNLKINREKIQFALGEVELLGVKVNGREQTPNDIKKNEALVFPVPRNIKELRRFLGLAGWFRGFVKNFAGLTARMTASLRGDSSTWKWSDSLQEEFERLKEALRSMRATILPNYGKEFVLKTDASNVGLGAVLMQEVDGKLLPVQWASKKLTPTESRYGISEKEMLAIYWGIRKFEYELRGRRFKLVTDHKALENIRTKPNFNNNRINRWVEQIQEFDFTIEYQKPEKLMGPDALSRIYEDEEKVKRRATRTSKILEGKANKHVLREDGKEYWVSDSGLKREHPEVGIRKELAEKAHMETNHRGVEASYYNLKQKYYWIGMKKTVENVVKRCEICLRTNRKNSGGCDFVETGRQLEKVALDLVDLGSSGKYALLCIDYFTRFVMGCLVENKRSETILDVVRHWCEEGKPEEIITDNGREFSNEMFTRFCQENRIEHRRVAVESHRSNGRIERVIRTIREGLLKAGGNDIETKLAEVIQKYNNTFHRAIGKTPKEAVMEEDTDLVVSNSKYGGYAKAFKRGSREVFTMGQSVLIARRENLGVNAKEARGRFLDSGQVVGVFGDDSYLVRKSDGKLSKKRHFDLKGVADETTVSRGGC